ncbi:hypothetical protein CU669_10510 [Paramagnetospirillum kuznetsovii]|uniref:Cytochrome C n=1 Tax=Paramagnetospirillum kuznetsovii TaxID=2053833 RepID=A0A364NZ25_9PROT|nr:hypothetical protein [Paramagnetospirillum kuznetsovii]RAU22155.1 hypothetical protein CU669_10510 [Paramagnetospirillum kuznetsovii]
MTKTTKPALVRILTVIAALFIGGAYFSPIWWVALKAPNYPADTFPDGIRIHFHMNGVFNGCTSQIVAKGGKAEAWGNEEGGLNCVEEMDVINHFIGMEPIARGAALEIHAAPYLFGLVGVMLAAFLVYAGPFWWILPLSGIVIPVAFVVDYSAWLWWFGHNLRSWAAFSVKPFMPTVFGDGKVAQFSTYSYPHYGFGLLCVGSLCLILALLLQRKALKD